MKKSFSLKTLALAVTLVFAGTSVAQADLTDFAKSLQNVPDKLQAIPGKVQATIAPRYDFKDLVKQAGPAVVNISSERTANVPANPFHEFFRGNPFGSGNGGGGPFGNDDFGFFFSPFDQRQQMRQRKQTSLGSGFFISNDGYIVTNYHVIENADTIKVNFDAEPKNGGNSESSYDAEVIGTDKQTDLALLKIKVEKPVPFITFGNSDELEVGEWVVAIGNPFGLDHSVTAGILSAKFRNIDSSSLVRFLQTDASINPGNSGGPLLNMKGEVIGINTAIVEQGQGIGFAIPSTLAKKVIDDLRADRKVSRGWLGVTIQDVDEATAKALGLPKASGALIGGVIPGQPAEKGGLEAGDVVLKINATDIDNSDTLLRTVAEMRPSDTATITVWREGKTRELKVLLAERTLDEEGQPMGQPSTPGAPGMDANPLGLNLRPLSDQEFQRLELDPAKGGMVVLQMDPGKLAIRAGIRQGDIIMSVGRVPVRSVAEFNKAVNDMVKKQGAVMLQIYRNGQQFIRSIDINQDKGQSVPQK